MPKQSPPRSYRRRFVNARAATGRRSSKSSLSPLCADNQLKKLIDLQDSKKSPIRSIYLAGPDVFRPNPFEIAKKKKDILAKYGLVGHFPMDNEIDSNFLKDLNMSGKSDTEIDAIKSNGIAMAIGLANEQMMRDADCGIFNMTPYRGPSMDVGTAFEIGFMRALGKPVFGYTNHTEKFKVRSKRFSSIDGEYDPKLEFDKDENRFEEFNLVEN